MALKMNNVYCGDGFPNLPDFKDLSGGGSGSAAVMAGQAIRISDISVSNVSYKRVNANVDDLTIAVDGVTNKLKSLVKGVKDYSATEQDTGIKWTDNKSIYQKTIHLTSGWGTTGDWVDVDTTTPIDTLIAADLIVKQTNGPTSIGAGFIRLVSTTDYLVAVRFYQNKLQLCVSTYTDISDIYITIKYTKTA